MIALFIYLVICFIWGWFAVYKQSQFPFKQALKQYIFTYFINFVLFPYCLFLAIKKNDLTFKYTRKHEHRIS